jgi:hypothetical protein
MSKIFLSDGGICIRGEFRSIPNIETLVKVMAGHTLLKMLSRLYIEGEPLPIFIFKPDVSVITREEKDSQGRSA